MKCAANEQVPLLVLHDFDKAGFSILGMLSRSNRSVPYRRKIDVIDLGLRLADVEAEGLEEAETVFSDDAKMRRRGERMRSAAR